MTGLYAQWMDRWERKLATRDTNRVVRPFEWGADWLNSLGLPRLPGRRQRQLGGLRGAFRRPKRSPIPSASSPTNRSTIIASHGSQLTFTSPVHTPYPENNTRPRLVVSRPATTKRPRGDRPAAVELRAGRPCGSGQAAQSIRHQRAAHDDGLSRRAQAGGDRARRLSCLQQRRPHHPRRPPVGASMSAPAWTGSSARATSRIGILGTSLGSCVAFIAAAHDPRIRTGIFNHVSMNFADVVWTGLSTQNVRQGFRWQCAARRNCGKYWSVISPASYLHRFKSRDLKCC